jgi:hypothetical protein
MRTDPSMAFEQWILNLDGDAPEFLHREAIEAVHEEAEVLLLLGREVRALSRSRLNAGIIYLEEDSDDD